MALDALCSDIYAGVQRPLNCIGQFEFSSSKREEWSVKDYLAPNREERDDQSHHSASTSDGQRPVQWVGLNSRVREGGCGGRHLVCDHCSEQIYLEK
jgi:hypothetical protein